MMKQAEWIWWTNEPQLDEYAEFLDVFTAKKSDGAMMQISVAGDYNVYLNGTLVAFGQYADYPTKKVYDEVDLSAYIKDGENDLRIVAWYMGESFSTNYSGGAGLAYELTDKSGKILNYSRAGMRSRLSPDYVSHRKR